MQSLVNRPNSSTDKSTYGSEVGSLLMRKAPTMWKERPVEFINNMSRSCPNFDCA